MKLNHLFWGLFLLVLGGLILIGNYTNFSFEFESLLKFWPLVLILIGLKILIRNKIMSSTVAVFAAILLAFIVYHFIFQNVTCRSSKIYWDSEGKKETISQNFLPSIKKSYLDVEFYLGDFYLDTNSEKLIEGEINFRKGEYYFDGEISDTFANYRLIPKDKENISALINDKFNDLYLRLNPKPEWEIKISTNFVKQDLDLTQINLRTVDLSSSFSKGKLVFAPISQNTKIDLVSNFSSLSIQIPDTIGVEIFINKNFSSVELNNFYEAEKNHFKSKNFNESKFRIRLDVSSNFSIIEIE